MVFGLTKDHSTFFVTQTLIPMCILVDVQLRRGDANMKLHAQTRRSVLVGAGSTVLAGTSGLFAPARAEGLAPTKNMRGGWNNYLPNAPIVDRIGGGGFWMTGTVRRAGDGAPLAGQRIQIWAHTTEGHERDQRSHGATLTDANGHFRLEMPQVVPAFDQAHGHLAYDSGDFIPVFLRPVMANSSDTTLAAHFVLQPV